MKVSPERQTEILAKITANGVEYFDAICQAVHSSPMGMIELFARGDSAEAGAAIACAIPRMLEERAETLAILEAEGNITAAELDAILNPKPGVHY